MVIQRFISKGNRDAVYFWLKKSGLKNIRKTDIRNIHKSDMEISDIDGYRFNPIGHLPKKSLRRRLYLIEYK